MRGGRWRKEFAMPLVKRGNSKFWYVQFQLNGRTFVRSTRTTDRKEAEKVEAQVKAEAYAEGVLGKKKQISVSEALLQFLMSKEGTPSYRNLVRGRKALLVTFSGNAPISSLTNSDLDRHKQRRTQQGRGPQTIKHDLNVIMGAIRYAKRNGFDVPDLTPPTVKIPGGKLRYLSSDEERRLLRELAPDRVSNGLAPADERDPKKLRDMQDNYDLIVILLDTGARYSEIATLMWDQVDLPNREIRLWRSKVENESLIFMTTRVTNIIAKRLERRTGKFVFSNSKGGARRYSVIAIRKAFDRAGLHDCTVHTLRHTHASRLIQNGMSVYEVKSVLGHADIRTTMRYAHLEEAKVTSRARDIIESFSS
ncbi:MAG: site-specific integrase [Verrucomicrobiaceae bacterium]|nr:MAG: site-specific integrase [Verrucomicrobiaceae bacterium]